jgi:hypothetical protein
MGQVGHIRGAVYPRSIKSRVRAALGPDARTVEEVASLAGCSRGQAVEVLFYLKEFGEASSVRLRANQSGYPGSAWYLPEGGVDDRLGLPPVDPGPGKGDPSTDDIKAACAAERERWERTRDPRRRSGVVRARIPRARCHLTGRGRD